MSKLARPPSWGSSTPYLNRVFGSVFMPPNTCRPRMANTTVNRHRSAAMLMNELRELRSTSPITRRLETY